MSLNGFVSDTLSVSGWGLVLQLVLIIVVVAALNLVARVALSRAQRRFAHTETPWGNAFIEAVRRPLTWLLWLVGLCFAAEVFRASQSEPVAIFKAIAPVREVGVIALLSWFLLRFIKEGATQLLSRQIGREQPLDRATVDAMSKLLQLSVVIAAVLVVLQTLGFSIAGVLAFGGIGGLAVGLAAQGILSNFFGGLTIYLDRPFGVGDWIRSPDRNIEGTVEYIGWRQTRIRTAEQRPLYVPNSTFNQIALENPSRMFNRRIFETIGIRYQDADRIGAVVADTRAMLAEHPAIDSGRGLIVNLSAFGPSSLDFTVNTYTKTTDGVLFSEIKQDVLLKILAIISAHGAELALPTSAVRVAGGVKPEESAAAAGAKPL